MLRVFLTIVVPLVLPTALYLVWLRVARWSAREEPEGSTQGQILHGVVLPWVWLATAGVALLGLVLFVVTVHYGTSQPGIYVPPRWENGRIVPGHIEPTQNQ